MSEWWKGHLPGSSGGSDWWTAHVSPSGDSYGETGGEEEEELEEPKRSLIGALFRPTMERMGTNAEDLFDALKLTDEVFLGGLADLVKLGVSTVPEFLGQTAQKFFAREVSPDKATEGVDRNILQQLWDKADSTLGVLGPTNRLERSMKALQGNAFRQWLDELQLDRDYELDAFISEDPSTQRAILAGLMKTFGDTASPGAPIKAGRAAIGAGIGGVALYGAAKAAAKRSARSATDNVAGGIGPTNATQRFNSWVGGMMDMFRQGTGAEPKSWTEAFGRHINSVHQVGRMLTRHGHDDAAAAITKEIPKIYEEMGGEVAETFARQGDLFRRFDYELERAAGGDPKKMLKLEKDISHARKTKVLQSPTALPHIPDRLRQVAVEVSDNLDHWTDRLITKVDERINVLKMKAQSVASDPKLGGPNAAKEIMKEIKSLKKYRKTVVRNQGAYMPRMYEAAGKDVEEYIASVRDDQVFTDLHNLLSAGKPNWTLDDTLAEMRQAIVQVGGRGENIEDLSRLQLHARNSLSEHNLMTKSFMQPRQYDENKALDRAFMKFLGEKPGFSDRAEAITTKMALAIIRDDHQRALRNVMEGSGLASRGAKGGMTTKVTDPTQNALRAYDSQATHIGPLDDLATYTEVAEALKLFDQDFESGLVVYVSQLAKSNQLLTSIGSNMRNFVSGGFNAMAQGREGILAWKDMFAGFLPKNFNETLFARTVLKNVVDDQSSIMKRSEEIYEAIRLNVLTPSARAGELQHAQEWARGYEGLASLFRGSQKGGAAMQNLAKANKGYNKAMDFLQRFYANSDNAWKMNVWKRESKVYDDFLKNADPSTKKLARELWGVDVATGKMMSAENIQQVMQNYNRTAAASRLNAKNPFFGAYASFPMESIRNYVNGFSVYAKEMKMYRHLKQQGNLDDAIKWRKKASNRMAGLLVSNRMMRATGHLTRKYAVGLSLEEQDAAYRLTARPYEENDYSLFRGMHYDDLGNPKSTTTVYASGMDYWSAINTPIHTFLRGTGETLDYAALGGMSERPMEDRIMDAAGEFFGQFLATELWIQGAYRIATGAKPYASDPFELAGDPAAGLNVAGYRALDAPLDDYLEDIAMVAVDFGPRIGRDVHRTLKAVSEGRFPGEELARMAGAAGASHRDFEASLKERGWRAGAEFRDARNRFLKAEENTKQVGSRMAFLAREERIWEKNQARNMQVIQDAFLLGLTPQQVMDNFKIPKKVLNAWLEGKPLKFRDVNPSWYEVD